MCTVHLALMLTTNTGQLCAPRNKCVLCKWHGRCFLSTTFLIHSLHIRREWKVMGICSGEGLMRSELRDAAPIWLKFLPAWLEIFVVLDVLPSNTVLYLSVWLKCCHFQGRFQQHMLTRPTFCHQAHSTQWWVGILFTKYSVHELNHLATGHWFLRTVVTHVCASPRIASAPEVLTEVINWPF